MILAVVTVPLHALVLPPRRRAPAPPSEAPRRTRRRGRCARAPFWLLSVAFFLASLAGDRDDRAGDPVPARARPRRRRSPPSRSGWSGVSQIPGRLLFGPLAARLPPVATAAVFALIARRHRRDRQRRTARVAVLAGLVVLGMGNGMATLARATVVADRYGPAAYGTIAGVAAALTTGARAAGPVAGARRARRWSATRAAVDARGARRARGAARA